MAVSDARGFTLVEVLIAMAVAAIVTTTAYVLLDSGLAMHDRGTDIGISTVGMARTMTLLRADVAASNAVTHAGPDSLVLAMPDGDAVEWVVRGTTGGLDVFRSVDDGGGFSERPKQSLARLLDTDAMPAGLTFTTLASGLVRASATGDGCSFAIEAAPWGSP